MSQRYKWRKKDGGFIDDTLSGRWIDPGRSSVHELNRLAAELERVTRERDAARAIVCEAHRTLNAAYLDLSEWRQFARYNAAGIVCGEGVPLPDPPQRPTMAELDKTDRVMSRIRDTLACTVAVAAAGLDEEGGGQ